MPSVTVRGLRFNYLRMGSGPRTVVFVHGIVADNLASWYLSVAPKVSKTCSVLLYDLRGHGLTERPPSGYRMEDHVEDLKALLDALELRDPVDLIGHSFGGHIVAAFAAKYPDRLSGMAIVDGHFGGEGWGVDLAELFSTRGEEGKRLLEKQFGDWAGKDSVRKRTRLADTAKALLNGTTLLDDLRASEAVPLEALGRVQAPALLIYGEHSEVLEGGRMLAAALPNAELRLIPDCTHKLLFEATSQVRDILAEWVQRP